MQQNWWESEKGKHDLRVIQRSTLLLMQLAHSRVQLYAHHTQYNLHNTESMAIQAMGIGLVNIQHTPPAIQHTHAHSSQQCSPSECTLQHSMQDNPYGLLAHPRHHLHKCSLLPGQQAAPYI